MPIYNERHPQYVTTLADGYRVTIPAPEGGQRTRTLRGAHTAENLARAERVRDRMYRALYGSPVPQRVFHLRSRDAHKASPLVDLVLPPGVTYLEKKVKSRHGSETTYVVPCIMAVVHLEQGSNHRKPKRSRSKLFSLNKYALKEAIKQAALWRAAMCKQLAFGAEAVSLPD